MQITREQSLYIASYLRKGAFERNFRDISVPIGDNTEIGISKKAHNNNIYIKLSAKIIAWGPERFSSDISVNRLRDLITELVNNNPAISDIDFDMRKVPMAELIDDTEDDNISDDTSTVSTAPPVFEDCDEVYDDEGTETYESDDNVSYENYEETGEEKPSENSTEDILDKDDKNEPVESGDSINIEHYTEAPENSIDDIIEDNLTVPQDEIADIIINEDKEINMDNNNEKTTVTNNDSYLYRLDTPDQSKAHMKKVFNALVDNDRKKSVEIYTRAVAATLDTYKGSIEEMSEAVGIDKRDIAIAKYEYQSLTN